MQLFFDFPVNPKFSLENFVVCTGNKAAYHFTRQLAEGDGTENLLYIYGPAGSGKTHLLSALGNRICETAGLPSLPSLSFRNINEYYHGSFPAEEESRLAGLFRNAPALLIDDLDLIPDNSNIRVELWQLFNDFYSAGKVIAITGLYPPKELPGLDDHLTSRLLWGLVAKIDVSDDDSRRMILAKLSEDRQIILPADVIEHLLIHIRRDIPSLLAALETIKRFSMASGKKITLRLAKESLAQR
jgi:chromosomal replication initiator protein